MGVMKTHPTNRGTKTLAAAFGKTYVSIERKRHDIHVTKTRSKYVKSKKKMEESQETASASDKNATNDGGAPAKPKSNKGKKARHNPLHAAQKQATEEKAAFLAARK